jgi:hypothetical protein
MGNHVHFVLYGELDECQRFVNEYVKRTSMAIESRHGESKKLRRIPVDFQPIEDDLYLKTVICYVIRNATAAGLPYLPWDYPWSSGPLYFRKETIWTYPCWTRMESLGSTTNNWQEKETVQDKRTTSRISEGYQQLHISRRICFLQIGGTHIQDRKELRLFLVQVERPQYRAAAWPGIAADNSRPGIKTD